MKSLTKIARGLAPLAVVLVLGAPVGSFAATFFLDQNGTNPGLWDGTTTFIGADLIATTNWTTTAAGTAATTIFSAANNMQFGNVDADFNGVTINVTNNFNGSMGGNPALLSIVSTNVVVNFIATSVNQRFNHATTIAVTNGSTLNFVGNPANNYNWNAQQFTFVGNGTVNVSNVLGNNDSTTSGGGITMNMTGGKMLLYQTGIGTFGNGGTGAGAGFTLTNGTLCFASPQSFANVFGAFASIQTVKLNGGALDNLSGAPGTINVNNGSYSVGGNFTYVGSSQNMSLGPQTVTLAVTPQVTVSANTLTMGGVVTDNGAGFGLTKAGNGTLSLTNASTYVGPTTVNGGTLIVSAASTGNGTYTVADNATLAVKLSAVGQVLNMTGLTVGGATGGTLQFDVGLLGNPTVAPINVSSGTLTVNGAANPISLSSISAITNYPVVIPLIHYGTVIGNLSSFVPGTFPAATPPFQGFISNDSSGQIIDLVLTSGLLTQPPGPAKPVTWLGAPNGNWDTTTLNWLNGSTITNYANLTTSGTGGDPVTFDDTLTGTTNVNLTTALSPASITLNNNNSNYGFSGSGRITGTASLTMNGTGSLLLDNSGKSDFTGGVNINAGTLQIGNNDTNGNPGTGPILNNGVLVINRTDSTLGVSAPLGVISGSGFITNNGSGTLTLGGVQPFAGTIAVNAGTLAVTGPNSNPSTLSATTNLTINGGIVQFLSDNVDGTTMPGIQITINTGGVLTGNGTSSHLPGLLTMNGGTLRMDGNQNNTSFGTWDLNSGVTVPGGPATSTISALNVVPNQGGGTLFNVTNGATASGIDLLISGTLINGTSAHDTGITKNGPGTMALDNNNTYTNGTIINGGTMQVGVAGDAAALIQPLGYGAVTINAGSILSLNSGKGVTISNSIADDGTGIVLVNRGSNVFSGVNFYSGQTIIRGGTALTLNNLATINGSALINVSNATLDASAGGVISSSGALAMTNSTFNLGTNLVTTMNSLSVSNSALLFQLNPNSPNINVGGALVTGGTANVIKITAVQGYPVYPTNITLIKYGSFANVDGNNNFTALSLSLPAFGSPVGYLTNNVANASIDLVLQGDTLTPIFPITWNGQTNGVNIGNWDSLTISNWVLNANLVTPYTYQDTSAATFDDTAHGTTSVILTTAVKPGSLTISNAVKSYNFSGAGSIGGGLTLVKTNTGTATFAETGGDNFTGGVSVGGGTLILSNANANISGGLTVNNGSLVLRHSGAIAGGLTVNSGSVLLNQAGTISGGTMINAGTVQVGNGDAVGSLPAGALTNNDTLIFNRSDTALVVNTVIWGSGAVTNNGTGTVTWTTTNTYTGPTVANAGNLVLSGGNFPVSGLRWSSELIINSNASVQILTNNSLAGGAAPLSSLPITINAGGLLTGAAGANAGAGTSTHIPGLLTLNGGTLANSGTSLQLANGSWDLDNGVATLGGPFTSTISAFDVIPTQGGGTHFTAVAPTGVVPASGVDLNVTGSLINGTGVHDAGVIIDGNGTVAFSGTNTYIQGTLLNSGVLIANAAETPGVSGPLGNTGLITFNGGTLRYSVANGFDYSARFNQGGFYTIDTAGQNVTFATALTGGGLTKLGNGTLALAGANNYSGDTVIARGKLVTTTASTGAGNYIATNSTLDVQVAGAGTQLTMNGLTLGNALTDVSTLQVDTLATGNPTVAPVNVTGTFATNGLVNIALSGTALTANTFPLIAYAGASPSAFFHFLAPAGFTGSLSDNQAGLISATITVAINPNPTTNANITKVSLSGTNLLVHGTNNNVPNTSFRYVVLTSTNIRTALSNWTPVVTNSFNSDGTFDYSAPMVPGTPQQFIEVQAVP